MPTSQETMYNEALSAIHSGDRERAKDLLTRLLKNQPGSADYWVWMSAVVDTPKERAYCLKEALRFDPQNTAAVRGLVLMGLLPPDPAGVLPAHFQRRNWREKFSREDEAAAGEKAPRKMQWIFMGAAFVLLAGLAGFLIWGPKGQANRPLRMPVIDLPTNTAQAGADVMPTPGARVSGQSGTPDPLWMQLKATYTPTPLYINTPHSMTEAYSIGMRAFERGDWANAVTYLSQAADFTSQAPDILFYLGEAYRMQAKYTSALDQYNQAISQSPEFAPVYYGRALALLALKPRETDAALEDLKTSLQKDPGFRPAYLGIAQVYLQSGRSEEALSALDLAAGEMPDSALFYLYRAKAYLALGDAKQSLANAQKARMMDVTLLEAYQLEGAALQADGDFTGSIEPLKLYTRYQPGDAGVWTALAKGYQANQQDTEARQALNKALQLDPQQIDAYVLRGQLLLDLKDAAGALEDFNAALRLDKESFAAGLGAGEALLALNQAGDAYMQFEKVQSLAKDDSQKAELQYWIALSLDRLGEVKAALRNYQALLALPKSNVKPEWLEAARARIAALATPTPTEKPQTATPTRTPTRTLRPTETRWPTATSRP